MDKNKVEYVIDPSKMLKYTRGKKVKAKHMKDRQLKNKLKSYEKSYDLSVKQAARSDMLVTEEAGLLEAEGLERTHEIKQAEIAESLNLSSAVNYFNLHLEQFGPYKIRYTKNGKFLLIGGQKGHLASIDWRNKNIGCEIHAQETVRDVTWLHQETFFASAQKKYVYIYDKQGTEIHCLKDHLQVNKLEYLPYHFLLVSVGSAGILKYQDTSSGKLISSLRTKLGRCDCMTQNSYNAIVNLGHHNGCVTMWSPKMKDPLIKMLSHRGSVLSLDVDKQGVYMATSGLDGLMKLWDIRMYKPVYTYRMKGRPAHSLTISQKGMLAAAFGSQIYIFKDALSQKQNMPYMKHVIPGADISSIKFCPYEDVLGVGHSNGFSSLIIPGSGEANFDALECNPYQSTKQRQEHEVKMLLEKIQPEMITLNPTDIIHIKGAQSNKSEEEKNSKVSDFVPKYKMKGKSSSGKVMKRKKGVKEDMKREELRAKNVAEKKLQKSSTTVKSATLDRSTNNSLDRFKNTK